jgi:hypothetical protein
MPTFILIANGLTVALRQIGTQLFWSMLAVTGEIVCTSTVVIYMLRHQVRATQVENPNEYSTCIVPAP